MDTKYKYKSHSAKTSKSTDSPPFTAPTKSPFAAPTKSPFAAPTKSSFTAPTKSSLTTKTPEWSAEQCALYRFLDLVAIHHAHAPQHWQRAHPQPLNRDNFEQTWHDHCNLAIAATIRLELIPLRRQCVNMWLAQRTVWDLMTQQPLNVFWAQMLAVKLRKRAGLSKQARAMLDQLYRQNQVALYRCEAFYPTPRSRDIGWSEFWSMARPDSIPPKYNENLIRRTLWQFAALLTEGMADTKELEQCVWRDHPTKLDEKNFEEQWVLHVTGSVVAGILTFRERVYRAIRQFDANLSPPTVWQCIASPNHTLFAQGILLMFRFSQPGHSQREVRQFMREHDDIICELGLGFLDSLK